MAKLQTEIRYYLKRNSKISLDPIDSDDMGNAILAKHLIGTLVRYSNGGLFQPYLAEKYSSSDDQQVWSFKLRQGLRCENGENISASGYIEGLKKVLREYAKRGEMPVISDLKGWSSFSESGELEGLRAVSDFDVEFHFISPVGTGFLEYLSMPYFGYFCEGNFNDKNRWNTDSRVISSGPYQLFEPLRPGSTPTLLLRDGWPLTPAGAPSKVRYFTDLPTEISRERSAIVQTALGWSDSEPEGFTRVLGPPDNIKAVVMNPDGPSGWFGNIENRRLLQSMLLKLRGQNDFRSKTATLAPGFYVGSGPRPFPTVGLTNSKKPDQPIKIYIPQAGSDDGKYLQFILKDAFKELGWQHEFYSPGLSVGVTSADSFNRTKFDVRITGVVAGSVMEPWVVEMMFCSNLGVSFPDPSGRICRYVKSLIRENNLANVIEAGSEVSRLVHEDAAVVPIFHSRTTWYFSDDLDLSRISGDLILPSFEDISFRE